MKLRSRLTLHMNGLLLVTVALITGVAMFGTVESLRERAKQDALDTAWLLANAASMAVSPLPRVEAPAPGEGPDAADAARSLAERDEWRRAVKRLAENPTGAGNFDALFVAEKQAQLLAWSAPDKTADLVSDYWHGIDVIAQESAANRAPIVRFLGQSVIASVPLKHRGDASWVFVCKFDTRRLRAAVAPALWRTAKLSLIGLLAGALVSSLLARQICRPIRGLADAVAVIGSGDFSHRVRVHGDANDELGVLAGSFNKMADSLESSMRRLARTEAEKSAQQREMEIAREIQKSLLPETCPQIENFDLAAFSAPASEVGGDFYDFIPLPSDRWGVVIADAMGKGVPAALLMALSRCLIRAYSYGEPSILKALELANNFLSHDTRSNMFITCFYMVVDPAQDTLTYVNAGHNPAVVTRTRGDVVMLQASGVPLGIFTETGLKEETCQLAPGDVAVLYTDGITEATDASGEFFGSRRLEEVIRNTRRLAASDICQRIMTAVTMAGRMNPSPGGDSPMMRELCLGLAAALLLWAPAASAGEAGGGEAKQPPRESRLPGEYVGIANRLKLDDATRPKFEEAVKTNEKMRRAWLETTFTKVGGLAAALREARAANDEALVKQIEAEQKTFGVASRNKMEADCTARIMALLNDEQKGVWQGFELRRFAAAAFWLPKLSDEQTERLQDLCEKTAKTLPAVTDDKYRAARDKVILSLRKEIFEMILTEEQRGKRSGPPAKKSEPPKEQPKKE